MIFYESHKVYMNGQYPAVYINGKSCHVHRLQWIKHYGEIPRGCVVHHKDENKLNWDIDNLELLSRKDHILQHKDVVHRKGVPIVAERDGVILEFESIEICAINCGTHPAQVRRCFEGIQKQSNGWRFRKKVVQ
jgi:hypothetical protein